MVNKDEYINPLYISLFIKNDSNQTNRKEQKN